MRIKQCFFALLILMIVFSVPAVAGSLWSEESGDLYSDRPEYSTGDIVTVVIEEESNAIQSANTSTSQSSEVGAEAGTGLLNFLSGFGFGYSDSGAADGQTQRSGTLEADISTQIVDILPTGNYRIEGEKKIKINGEEQKVILSGIIRPEDITLDNTVDSERIAEVDIEYDGQGVVSAKQSPSLLERLLNWIF